MAKLETKILVTGANGFVGTNLVANLKSCGYSNIYEYDISNTDNQLEEFCKDCQFVFNLAGVNRPQKTSEFYEGNRDFGIKLLSYLEKVENKSPIVLTSSIQAELDNDYGKSKIAGENILKEYGERNNVPIYIYRFPNIFGKWCRPNYNSAVATFCHNIARGLPLTVNDRQSNMVLVYIDDVINEFVNALNGKPNLIEGRGVVSREYKTTLGEIVDTLYSFKQSRQDNFVPQLVNNSWQKKLYSTYLSFIPQDDFSYPLITHSDKRGSFTEFIKTPQNGQISVNISKPKVVKGNHWHHSKNEKFLVVSGIGIIRFRKIDEERIIEYNVSGDKMVVVDIPCGYTHNIENLGDTDMVTIMWANESFDPDRPDTYFLEV